MLLFVIFLLIFQIRRCSFYQESYTFMLSDAACWWEVSQNNLSILLSSRYHEYVTVQILLIASCKKDWGYGDSCLNVTQIHIWTSWLRWRFFDCDDIHFVGNYKICGNLLVHYFVFRCLSVVFTNQKILCLSRRLHVHTLWCRSLMYNIPGLPLNCSVLEGPWTCNRSNIVDRVMQKGLGLECIQP